MAKKQKLDLDQESKTFIEASEPTKKQKEEAIEELVKGIVSLLVEFREKLPTSSDRYHKAITSIIVSLNSYSNYYKNHLGIWNGYDHLCMAYTQYSYLIYCTESKNPKRESKVQSDTHQFLTDLYSLWDLLLSQHLDYKSKH